MIHESLQQHITQIARQSSRALRVTLDPAKSKMPIRIISTYAPHNGHTEEEKTKLGDVSEQLNKTCRRHLIIWGADENGQLGNRKMKKQKNMPREYPDQEIIGPYAKASKTDRGNGAQLRRIFRRQQMIPTKTWKKPRIARQDKWKQQQERGTRRTG